MSDSGRSLLLPLLSELDYSGVRPSKTKLLKLLYLIDIEHCRSSRTTISGWTWKFHHFGPWAPEYDPALSSLEAMNDIEVKVVSGDREAYIIRTLRPEIGITSLDVNLQTEFCRVITRWAKADLAEILDFVYFETEPMKGAARGAPLRFDTVEGGGYPIYRRAKSSLTPKDLAKWRRRFTLGERPQRPLKERAYTAPKYDAVVLDALANMEDD